MILGRISVSVRIRKWTSDNSLAQWNGANSGACEGRSDLDDYRTGRAATPLAGGASDKHNEALQSTTARSARSVILLGFSGIGDAFSELWSRRELERQDRDSQATSNYLTPVAAKFSPDGSKLYVVCEDDDSVLAVDVRKQRCRRKSKGWTQTERSGGFTGWQDSVRFQRMERHRQRVDAATFQVQQNAADRLGAIGE